MKLSYNNAIESYTPSTTFPTPGELWAVTDTLRIVDGQEAVYPTNSMRYTVSTKHRMPAPVGKWIRRSLDKMPKGIIATLAAAQEEAVLEIIGSDAKEREFRGWELTPDETTAAIYSELNRIKEIEAWKQTQANNRHAQSHGFQINTLKVKTAGKRQWDNALVFEFPPLTLAGPNETGIVHVPARYKFKAPCGEVVDMGAPMGQLAGMLHTSPDKALQGIVTRLAKLPAYKHLEGMKGGAASILAAIHDRKDILPSYMTIWQTQNWTVVVGYKLNPKMTRSTYEEDEDGNLKRSKHGTVMPVSEVEYKIISAGSIGEEDDESSTVDGTMELDAELVEQGFSRDGERFDVDSDMLTGGMVLLEEAAIRMGKRNQLLAGEDIWTASDLRDTLAEMGRELIAKRHAMLAELKALQGAMNKQFNIEPRNVDEIDRLRKRMFGIHFLTDGRNQNIRMRGEEEVMYPKHPVLIYTDWRETLHDMWEQLKVVRREELPESNKTAWMTFRPRLKTDGSWTQPVQEGFQVAQWMPCGPAVEFKASAYTPEPKKGIVLAKGTRCNVKVLQRGRVTLALVDGTMSRVLVPTRPQAPTEAKNASPELSEVLKNMIKPEAVRTIIPRKQKLHAEKRNPMIRWGTRKYNAFEGNSNEALHRHDTVEARKHNRQIRA